MSASLLPQPKVILEGTHLTHKTDISFALAEHPLLIGDRKHRYHLPIISAEWETFSDQTPTRSAPGRSLITFAPHEESLALEAYEIWVRMLEIHRYYYWIIDRFHISTRAYQITNHNWDYRFEQIEARLGRLGFHLVLCVRSPATFEAARIERLKYSENPSQYDALQKFIDEQDLLRRLVKESSLPSLELDISDNNVGRGATEILRWMEGTGGLWPSAQQ